MNAIRIHRKLESDVLHLPELQPLIGKTVEIIVREDETPTPEMIEERWKALFEAAGADLIDLEVYKHQRTIS